jgi:glycosyltransferase involved in cell wall biosynthesis
MGDLTVNCKVRLLFLMRDALPPFRADVKALFGKYLKDENVCSDLLGQRDPIFLGVLEWPAGTTVVAGVDRKGMFSELIRPLRDLYAMLWHCESYDLIQVRDKIRTAVFGLILARLKNKPFVYWMSFPFVEGFEIAANNRKNPDRMTRIADYLRVVLSRKIFYGLVLQKADHIFVQSEAMRDWLANKGIPQARMTAVPMGVDVSVFQRELIIPSTDVRLDGRRVISYLGVLGKARNSEFLLDLVLALKECEPTILLVLAGDAASDDERQWIREEIAQKQLESHVLLTGWLSQDKALQYAVRAEVGLSPIPRGELFDVSSPTKLVEYLALGLPGVANDIPDQKLVIERSGAGLCVPMEIDAFRDAVLLLLRDPELHKRCAERGPGFVLAERSYETLAKGVAETYRSILDQKK